MYVTWITWNSTNDSYVSYAPAPNTKTSNPIDASIVSNFGARANGLERVYIDGGEAHRVYYVHRVTLTGLTPSTKYGNICLQSYNNLINYMLNKYLKI